MYCLFISYCCLFIFINPKIQKERNPFVTSTVTRLGNPNTHSQLTLGLSYNDPFLFVLGQPRLFKRKKINFIINLGQHQVNSSNLLSFSQSNQNTLIISNSFKIKRRTLKYLLFKGTIWISSLTKNTKTNQKHFVHLGFSIQNFSKRMCEFHSDKQQQHVSLHQSSCRC